MHSVYHKYNPTVNRGGARRGLFRLATITQPLIDERRVAVVFLPEGSQIRQEAIDRRAGRRRTVPDPRRGEEKPSKSERLRRRKLPAAADALSVWLLLLIQARIVLAMHQQRLSCRWP